LSKQADDVEQLRTEVRRLEEQLNAAKENERLLVEYPDLHFVNHATVSIAGLTTSFFYCCFFNSLSKSVRRLLG